MRFMKITLLDRDSLGMDTPVERLSQIGEVEIFEKSSPEQVSDRIKNSEVVIINKVKITREIIKKAKKLKLICVFATGYDNIDVEAAKEYGVGVCNVPGYSTDSVALYTVTTALSLYTHIFEYNDFIKRDDYEKSGCANLLTPVYHEISGKVWGIVGCGNIGRAVAKIAQALGAKVIVNKRTPIDEYKTVDIETLCRESDIISLHCPLNDSTRNLIDKEKISLMKESVVIVNEARGAVTNESDIADAINSGRIAAFGCDVYSEEPFSKNHPFQKIKNLPNVLLTPHAAWGAYEARERCLEIICNNIKSFYSGELKNRVDLQK